MIKLFENTLSIEIEIINMSENDRKKSQAFTSTLEGYKQSGEEPCWLNRNYPELSSNDKALKE